MPISTDMTTIAWDLETDLIVMGSRTPDLVCLQLSGDLASAEWAEKVLGAFPNTVFHLTDEGWATLHGASSAFAAWRVAYDKADILVSHNGSFDIGVLANHVRLLADRRYVNPVLHLASEGIESGKLRDTMTNEQLICIATDNAEFDRRWGKTQKVSYALATLAMNYLGRNRFANKVRLESLQKKQAPRAEWPWRYKFIDLVDTPVAEWPQDALDYALDDAHDTREVLVEQVFRPMNVLGYPVVSAEGEVVNAREQFAAALALHMMACSGVTIDPARVDMFVADIDRELLKTNAGARKLGILRINRCNDCDGTGYMGVYPDFRQCPVCQAQDHQACLDQGIYKRKALANIGSIFTTRLKQIVKWAYGGDPEMTPASKKFPRGQVKTDSDALAGIDNVPAMSEYMAGLKAKKWKSTYLGPLLAALDVNGVLTSSPNALVRSGRTSWRAPNLQNPPQKGRFRECFVPRKGMVFVSCDYSSLEMACLAQVNRTFFGKSKMGQLINEGVDLHAWFAAKLMGISYEEVQAKLAAGDVEAKAMRQLAKIPNFGLPGGLGAKGLVKYAKSGSRPVILGLDHRVRNKAGILLPSAYELKKAWLAAFPEMKRYFEHIANAAEMGGGKFALLQLWSQRVRGGATYTSGANSYFQGLAADGAKLAMWELFKACYLDPESPLFGVRMWAFIHDEFLFEGPEDTLDEWAKEASCIQVAAMKQAVPDYVIEAPPAACHRWYKSAEPVTDADDVLIPWVPDADAHPDILAHGKDQGWDNATQQLANSLVDIGLRCGASYAESVEDALWHMANGATIG